MDPEKAFYKDIPSQIQIEPAFYPSCKPASKKRYVLQCIFGLVLLGTFMLNTYQFFATSSAKASLAQAQRLCSSQVHKFHRYKTVPSEDDGWSFTVYAEAQCGGKSLNAKGTSTQGCTPFDKEYNAAQVTTLDETLKICVYNGTECKGAPTPLVGLNVCLGMPLSESYTVIGADAPCSQEL